MFKYLIVTEDFEVIGTDDIDQAMLWATGDNIVIDVATQEALPQEAERDVIKVAQAPRIGEEPEEDDDD